MEELFKQHDLAILQFSGGKDSLAVLELCRPYLDKIIVAWVDTGGNFPHVADFVYKVMADVPRFTVVRPSEPQGLSFMKHGFPVDIIPVINKSRLKIQPWVECCNRLKWEPMEAFVKESGATLVVNGQRNDEEMTNGWTNGTIVKGITYCYPLDEWTEEEVFAYLREQNVVLPVHYGMVKDSLDCYSCTAMADFTASVAKDREDFMQRYYPLIYRQVQRNKLAIVSAIEEEINRLEKLRS